MTAFLHIDRDVAPTISLFKFIAEPAFGVATGYGLDGRGIGV
jgi:hypothetical protein